MRTYSRIPFPLRPLVSVITALLILGTIFTGDQVLIEGTSQQNGSEELFSERLASRERQRHDFLMTQDPKLGKVPTERLIPARQQLKNYLDNPAFKQSAVSAVTWSERGPNNVSGRTRSILIDQSDASGNTVWTGGVGGGLWKTINGGTTWTAVDDFFANMAVTSIAQDPNNPSIIYFGTGERWASDGIRGLGIWKSVNGGASFTQLASTSSANNGTTDFDYINKIVVLDVGVSSYIFAATSSRFCNRGGVLRSTNGGSTWSKFSGDGVNCATTGGNDYSTDIEIASNGDLYAAFGSNGDYDGIYKSTNSGANWTKIYYSAVNESRIELACAPSNSAVVYGLVENDASNGIPRVVRTTNGGVQWFYRFNPNWAGDDFQACTTVNPDWTRGQDWYDLAIAVDPANYDIVYIGAVDLFKTVNGGASWYTISSWWGGCAQYVHADHHVIAIENSNEIWFGTDGGVYKTNNGTAVVPNISFKGNGLNITQFYAGDLHPASGSNVMIAGAQDNGTQRFTSPEVNNTSEVTGGDGAFCHIDQTNGNVQFASYTFNNYYITENSWASNTEVNGSERGRFINPTDYDDQTNILYGSETTDFFSRISLASKSYETVSVPNFPGIASVSNDAFYSISSVRVSPNTANRVYFGFNNGTVYKVDNAHSGTSNSAFQIFAESASEGRYVSCIEIENGNEAHMVVTLSNYGITSIYESQNATSATPLWIAVEGDLPDIPVRWAMFHPANNDQLIVATELGVWVTYNLNGASTAWVPMGTGLPTTRIDMVKYRTSDKRVVAATHGRGLFTTDDLTSDCLHDLLTLTSFADNTTYDNALQIQTSALMNKNNVVLKAQESINLLSGFQVVANKNFTIEVDNCANH